MTRGTRSSRGCGIAVLGVCCVLLTQQLLPATFCGLAPSNRLAKHSSRTSCVTAKAEQDSEISTSIKPTPEISPLLRLGSFITGLIKPFLQAQAKFAAGDYDQEKIRGLIEKESKSAPVVLYTLSQSPFSIDAKRLLDESSIKYKEIELAPLFILAEGENAARRAELGAMTGRTSMPHIFINGESIGGLYEGSPGLVPLIESGKLESMVVPPKPATKEESPLDGLMGMLR